MFRAETADVVVSVEPSFLPGESSPDEGRYLWAYRVTIENRGTEAVQLLARHWTITDANGVCREVSGPGVVGVQPMIAAGDSFTYTSGCPLSTPSGIMVGTYRMVTETGDLLDVSIPAFSLDMPGEARTLN